MLWGELKCEVLYIEVTIFSNSSDNYTLLYPYLPGSENPGYTVMKTSKQVKDENLVIKTVRKIKDLVLFS